MTKRNKNFAFALPDGDDKYSRQLVQDFFKTIQREYPELKIIGLERDKYYDTKYGIQNAGAGAIIEFNADEKYDVDFFGTSVAAALNGVTTDLNLFDDWDEIMELVDEYFEENYAVKAATRSRRVMYNPVRYSPRYAPVAREFKDNVTYKTGNGVKITLTQPYALLSKNGQSVVVPRYIVNKRKQKYNAAQRALIKEVSNERIFIGLDD